LVVMLSEEAGVGKTRLLKELQNRVRRGNAWMINGGSFYQVMPMPYFPFTETLRYFFRHFPRLEQQRLARFIETETPELRMLVPLIGAGVGISRVWKTNAAWR
jgi:hypothetical protein